MVDYKPLDVRIHQRKTHDLTIAAENAYWKRYGMTSSTLELGALVESIVFPPKNSSHVFAACSVNLIAIETSTGERSRILYSSNTNGLHCCAMRKKDTKGSTRLILAGDAIGDVHLIDSAIYTSKKQNNAIKSLSIHDGPVRSIKFVDDTSFISAGDDNIVRLCRIDKAQNDAIQWMGNEHSDFVRCLDTLVDGDNIFFSGSYDYTAKCWDTRQGLTSTVTFDHKHPLEDIIALSTNSLVTAGGTLLSLWDVRKAKQPVAQLSPHHKSIMSLHVTDIKDRILTSSLDCQVKVVNALDFAVVHTLHVGLPTIKVALSHDERWLSIATSRQQQIIFFNRADTQKQHLSSMTANELPEKKQKKYRKPRLFKLRAPDGTFLAQKHDEIVDEKAITKALAISPAKSVAHLRALRQMKPVKALKNVLSTNVYTIKNPHVIVSLLKELYYRNKLRDSISQLEDSVAVNLVKLIRKNLFVNTHQAVFIETMNVLCELVEKCPTMWNKTVRDFITKKIPENIEQNERLTDKLADIQAQMQLISTRQRMFFIGD